MGARDTIAELLAVLGVTLEPGEPQVQYPIEVVALAAELAGYEGVDPFAAADALLAARAQARKDKDWARADAVRDGLTGLGFTIEDTAQGARVGFEPDAG